MTKLVSARIMPIITNLIRRVEVLGFLDCLAVVSFILNIIALFAGNNLFVVNGLGHVPVD